MSGLQYIFVHGLSGWGSYDDRYRRMPYWGMRGGDLMEWLRTEGFDCYAASVSPTGSAWDRACELYAQLAGTRTDYGEAHSRRCGHERYGKDFSLCPLIPSWDDRTRLVLLGHSFGGATVRLLSELLAHGSAEERECPDPSPLFLGGMENRIHSIAALASPMNGTTAYDLFMDPGFDPDSVRVPWWSKRLAALMAKGTRPHPDGRDPSDYAGYDMQIDHALAMNKRISTLPSVYYFSVPCNATMCTKDGTWVPEKGMEPLFVMRSYQIGAYKGRTAGGTCIDESWRRNDGLVNTVSAVCPSGAPSRPLDRSDIRPGIWNVYPELNADHMWLQGGLTHKHDIRAFYRDLLQMIETTAKS
ncbi:MAG: hypothetical protein IIY52_04815 [Solobacterium sp.]|nr:hypothetical protein [Solobacterium sp.]